MALENFNKTFTFTKEQYAAIRLGVDIASRVLDQASPDDETPLQLSVMEMLQLAGEEIMGKLRGSQPAQPAAQPKK